jgi:hypothetical protein
MRFRLRTLLLLTILGPPGLAWAWNAYVSWVELREWNKTPMETPVSIVWESSGNELDNFRAPFSGLIELYDPRIGKSDCEDLLSLCFQAKTKSSH